MPWERLRVNLHVLFAVNCNHKWQLSGFAALDGRLMADHGLFGAYKFISLSTNHIYG
jgi:hypothetical protein